MWMSRDLVTISPEAPVTEAAVAMARRRVRRLPVVRPSPDGARLVGIVSSHDVMRAYPASVNPFSPAAGDVALDLSVAEIMSRAVHAIEPETPIEEAARMLRSHKIGALPVLHAGCLVGLITESDLLEAFIECMGGDAPGARVTFEIGADEPVLELVRSLAAPPGLRVASVFTLRRSDRWSNGTRQLVVTRLLGEASDRVIDALWKSGHRVLSVLRLEGPSGS
jgi:acetoin utilization protein AcuB